MLGSQRRKRVGDPPNATPAHTRTAPITMTVARSRLVFIVDDPTLTPGSTPGNETRTSNEVPSAQLARSRAAWSTPQQIWRGRPASSTLRTVPRVDSADDTVRRFVVPLHSYDPKRRERRPVEVGSFDNEAEAMRCFGETHTAVMSRRATGDADPRDHVTMVMKEPGIDECSRQRRIEERLRRYP